MKDILKLLTAAGVATVVAGGVSLAQYGLPPPPQSQPATGFADIVTSRVVGPDGGRCERRCRVRRSSSGFRRARCRLPSMLR